MPPQKKEPSHKLSSEKTPLNHRDRRRRIAQRKRSEQLKKQYAGSKGPSNLESPVIPNLDHLENLLEDTPSSVPPQEESDTPSVDVPIPEAPPTKSDIPTEHPVSDTFSLRLKKALSWKNKTTKGKVLYVIIALVAILFLVGGVVFAYEFINTPALDTENFNFVQNSQILDKNGTFYQDFEASENREVVSIDQVPDYVQNAFIAIEDERFYSHGGVDIQGLTRAVFGVVFSGSLDGPGGSTITQQLIKLTHLTSDKTISRKLQEMILASRLEGIYSKKQILEAYLNKINLSQAWGVQAAAKTYFNTDVSHLTVAQAAMLAAMPKSPSYYDPYVYVKDENGNSIISVGADGKYALNAENQKRAIVILDKMLELGYIDQSQRDTAKAELEANNVGLTYVEREIEYSYFTDSLYEEIVSDLMSQKNMTEEEASQYLLNGGLTINATVDPTVQTTMEEAAKDDSLFPSQSSAAAQASAAKSADIGEEVNYTPEVGMTVIDNTTGNVAGIVGGREKKTNLSLNRATQRFQPGSSTKPLTTYGPGLDTGKVTLGTVYNDVPIAYQGWTPQNSGGGFGGLTTIRQGLVNSTNTIAVQTCIATGLDTCAAYAEKVGLTIDRENNLDVNPASLALGGYSVGQSSLAMASAYSSFPNSGVHKSASFYTTVTDHTGKVILEKKTTETQVYKAQTAYLITDVLKSAVNGGTTTINVSGQPVAGKTGTTDEERHAWICGYTPYYSMAVWYGYDENHVSTSAGDFELNINLFGGSKPGPASIFEEVMDTINQNLPSASFPDNPGGITTASIDNKSGKLATSLSTAAGSAVNEMFIDGTVPTASDDSHYQVQICSASGAIPNEYCPKDQIQTTTALKIPTNLYPAGITEARPGYIGGNDASLLGPSSSDICTVHNATTAAAGNEITINLNGTALGSGSIRMSVGSSQGLSINGPNNGTTSVSSSNGGVVAVSGTTLTAVAAGSSTITVSQTVGNRTFSKSFSVTVQ